MSGMPTAAEAAERRRNGLGLARRRSPSASRLEVLATFNADLLPPFLVEAFDRYGLEVDAHSGAFDRLSQEILDPSSSLYASAPAEVALIPAAEDLLQALFTTPASQLPPAAADALVDERVAELGGLVETLLERLPASTVYLVVFGTDRLPLGHVLDPAAAERGQVSLERFTAGLRRFGALSKRVVVVDWDWHVRAAGWEAARDDRLWYLGRMRLSPVGCAALAELVAKHAAAFRGRVKKVIALDLDGLLWGGVIGEAGLSGIEIGEDGVGLAFQDFQRELLKLHGIGVLLVTCSKNNEDDVLEVFDRHPGMVLRREHLTAERVNWQDKATNLRELAEELSLGLDSFVFLDDNPVERDWVRQACPEVVVPEVPDDPAERPAMLRNAPWFARVATTAADLGRATSYREQRERRQLQQSATSFEDFLASLEQEVLILDVDEGSLARAAQLCQRTNQFNLTTKRYTVSDLERMMADDDYDLFTLSVRDRFGESGITGLGILHHEDGRSVVDTLLMSCRILGRRVEDAFLAYLSGRAASRGSALLVGLFEPTAKNAQVASFYVDRGFVPDGTGAYSLDLRGRGAPAAPAGIVVKAGSDA